jgi:uncharacterized protein YndB with AHSA1/START domain
MKQLMVIFAVAFLAGCAEHRPTSPAPESVVSNTSFTDTAGVRTIQLSVHVKATQAEVFAAVATSAGWRSWAVPVAIGEPQVGGVMETSYDAKARVGDVANIQQEFLALLPNRLVVFHTKRAPPGFPEAELFYRTHTIVEIGPEGSGARVTLSHTGFAPGPGYDTLHKFFSAGDAETMDQLRKRFESGPVDWSKAK